MTKKVIFGAGAALVDLLIHESEEYLMNLGVEKGGMTIVAPSFHMNALDSSQSDLVRVPGGSACNTIVGVAQLGGKARFLGSIGMDETGRAFGKGLSNAGVEAMLAKTETPTGQVLSVITPDAQRTMFTYLGASAELNPKGLESVDFSDVAYVHIEGYLAFNAPYLRALVSKARKENVKISLDLASFEVVRACRDILDEILQDGVDVLIGNEDEAKEFAGTGAELKILAKMSEVAKIAVYKKGARGVLIFSEGNRLEVPTQAVEAVDTTGAGDLWASGFLYGLGEGWELKTSARLGNMVAGQVVQTIGAVISPEVWKKLNDSKNKMAV